MGPKGRSKKNSLEEMGGFVQAKTRGRFGF